MERSMRLAKPVTRRPYRSRTRGFTLVELAIVVAIVGVLAVIATVGYRKYILSAKITEAKGTLTAIRIAQEDHRAERGTYVDLGTSWCPANAGTGKVKVGWDKTCGTGGKTWEELPLHFDSAMLFQYAVNAGNTAKMDGSPLSTGWVAWNAPTQVPWYVVVAKCDLDDDSSTGPTQLATSSYANQVFSTNEGM